jgi:ribosome-binding protein aMBF1 (putative translation factor)
MLTIVCCIGCILKIALASINLMAKTKSILIKFGKNVREARKLKVLSQEQLSFKADLHRTYIGMIERAEKNITLLNIEKIARALEIEISELLK